MHLYTIDNNYFFNPFHSEYGKQDLFANSEDPNEISHKVVFPKGLLCLLRLKQSAGGGGCGLVSIRL